MLQKLKQWLDGLAYLFVGPNYTVSNTPEEDDLAAIANDWKVVGDDLRAAIEDFHQKHIDEPPKSA